MSIGPMFFPWERIPAYIIGPALFALSTYWTFTVRPLTIWIGVGLLALMALSLGIVMQWYLRDKTLGARDQTPADQPVVEAEELRR